MCPITWTRRLLHPGGESHFAAARCLILFSRFLNNITVCRSLSLTDNAFVIGHGSGELFILSRYGRRQPQAIEVVEALIASGITVDGLRGERLENRRDLQQV